MSRIGGLISAVVHAIWEVGAAPFALLMAYDDAQEEVWEPFIDLPEI